MIELSLWVSAGAIHVECVYDFTTVVDLFRFGETKMAIGKTTGEGSRGWKFRIEKLFETTIYL